MTTRLSPLTLAVLVALGPGCAPDNTTSVQPAAVCAMPDDCMFSSSCDATFIGTPALDVSYGTEMWLAVEMRNQLKNNADEELGRVNTHDAHFESYTLEYEGITAGIDPAALTDIPASGGRAQQLIPAEGGAVIGFTAIPIAVVQALAGAPAGPDYDEVLVKVTLKGRYEDGSKWEAPFKIPVQICTNCLGAACSDPTKTAVSACPSLAQSPRGKAECL